jgi:DNA/RNA-binding domain of Phe-tRNA-synthetase-like protein
MAHDPFVPRITPEIGERFPSYRALSVVVRRFVLQHPTEVKTPVVAPWCDAHIVAWHEAFRAFGSNPKGTAPSVDALVRRFRKDGVLPVIDPVVDCYNALSIRFGAPFGGEDVDRYIGVPRLEFADGSESFDTIKDGERVVEHPDAGEVIWRDEQGVTCRRWNWRQCKRTALRAESVNLWFVIDRLAPMDIDDLRRAGDELVKALLEMSPDSSAEATLLQP